MVEADFAVERAVVLEFGRACAGCLVHFVASFPCEVDAGLGVATVEGSGHRTEPEFAASQLPRRCQRLLRQPARRGPTTAASLHSYAGAGAVHAITSGQPVFGGYFRSKII